VTNTRAAPFVPGARPRTNAVPGRLAPAGAERGAPVDNAAARTPPVSVRRQAKRHIPPIRGHATATSASAAPSREE